ncbi:GGDEF domain-containing protein [Colwellia sp. 75C3]|uniref:GGDEF domain-containing protein n=1 Tax=Colwellia sp. 75C3 TaxID=888425 RepID=UPI000C3319BB|nr:GGDEF domain-containing protein [Colwellia sp. 75C3]PKG83866.1 GGDEF domain-containing protein [Colwellia sp. 75C3]
MKFISQSVLMMLFLLLSFSSICQASEPENMSTEVKGKTNKSKALNLPVMKMLPINTDLLTLIAQLKEVTNNSQKIEVALAQLTLSKAPLNAAEQYLLLVAQVLLKENESGKKIDSAAIVTLLKQADKLSEKISEQQLSHPEFLQLHLLLADHYARLGKYELAYLEKKSYQKKYYIYRKNKRLAMIASLEQSFEVKGKKANNALLESQNKLKIRRVAEVQDEKSAQQDNLTLIIGTAIVFVLLFFRQLRIRNKLILLTRTDGLTGLANRSALFERGQKMVVNFTSQPTELSVLLLDLDHFKKINDNFGHQVGDEILVIVSQLVKETMRSRDVFSRLGGEEFVALLPFADSNKAKAIAMRINDKIAQYDFSEIMLQSKVTISVGVVTMKHSQITFDDLLHNADLAMHQAKEQGRNTVVCYQDIAAEQERRAN